MFYKALGFVVWKLSTRYLRRRYGRLVKPGAAIAVVGAVAVVYVATRNGE